MSPPDGGLLLVNYHYVRATRYRHPGIYPVSPDTLRQQVRRLGETCHRATPAEVEAFGRGEAVFERPAVFFTFDDGLLDHLLAAEILDETGTKGRVFRVVPPLAGAQARFRPQGALAARHHRPGSVSPGILGPS